MTKKVMIVDDDKTMNQLLQTLLELDGFQVILEPNGSRALATARAEKPDGVLMDVHIGEADGVELLKQFRADPAFKTLPVVMSSGMDVEDRCQQAGCSAFILKPYPPDELSNTFKKLLP
jgi:CheY-like chemotaxis protein